MHEVANQIFFFHLLLRMNEFMRTQYTTNKKKAKCFTHKESIKNLHNFGICEFLFIFYTIGVKFKNKI
jgi:hypothetical protein